MLSKRWAVERSFGWPERSKRLSRDCERLASTLTGMHWLAFAALCALLYLAKMNDSQGVLPRCCSTKIL
ncbi:transposase [Prosthecobacter fluviatilis]|uniref:Transposase n=1 Tax=Prosthecobacter fluviatilis TaxID=445931 RepID=A0ABW0KNA4_9BACT